MNWINIRTIITSIVAAFIAGLSVYYYQQREIDRLRGENQSILTQQAELSKERDAALLTATASRDELERLQKDKGELLRLRGEVGLLRKQTKEAEQLKESNRLLSASLAQAGRESQQRAAESEEEQQKQLILVRMTEAKQLMVAMLMFAADNQDQIPADINLVSNYLSKAESPFTKFNQFDLVIQGSLKNIANPSTTIAVRERETSLYKGERARVYGFMDGHSELKREPPEGFDAWEKAHTIPLQP